MRGGKLRGTEVAIKLWEVECEVFMRGACKLRGRKMQGVTMTARGGDGETPCLLHNRCICMVLVGLYEEILMLSSP